MGAMEAQHLASVFGSRSNPNPILWYALVPGPHPIPFPMIVVLMLQ